MEAQVVEDIAAKFPGPVAFRASRLRWIGMIILCSGMTAVGIFLAIFLCVHPEHVKGDAHVAVGMPIICAVIFGLATLASVIAFRSGSLRLDADGFVATGIYSKHYSWIEVSDFGISSGKYIDFVVFKTSEKSTTAKINALLADGRNDRLPDTYGFSAKQLVQLMERWQSLATSGAAE